ncbi:head GIN domain-containing protein [Hymenobacter koreensis]|uniref:Head GIN domain-containing protein n=1 Tax=Hymenobacter koreensis TaxID=1084523 RepID=A0ABP8IXI3_9BACT
MKTNWLPSLLFSTLLLTASCNHDGDSFGPRVRGTGPTQSETRTLNAFSRVELKVDADVVITQGPQQEVRIEAQRNILDVLETELNGDQLEIEFGRVNVRSHDPIRIYITVPSLSEVEVAGSGSLRSNSAWSANSFRVGVSGSGKADLDLANVNSLRTTISGSGEVNLRGTAPTHTISISGSGRVNSYDLITQDTNVNISGSGRSYVYTSRNLNAEISGSGTVYYRGTPLVTTRISGSGKVLTGN